MKSLRVKLTYLSLAVIIVLICFAGCEPKPEYYGTYVDLNTVALNNILGLTWLNGSRIMPIAEDSFGRQMFIYRGYCFATYETIYSILICQKTEGKYVYYYPDNCFLLYKGDGSKSLEGEELVNKAWELMSDQDLGQLQAKNDWEKPIDETHCSKTRITRTNIISASKTIKSEFRQAFLNGIQPDQVEGFIYLTSDNYNRQIYFSRIYEADGSYGDGHAVMFYPSGYFNYVKITDFLHYQDAMKEFKVKNNWNEPLT